MAGLPEIHLSANAYTVGHWVLDVERPDPEHSRFDLSAPYQRASVWSLDQRRGLIKSLYMGLPVGSVIVSNLPYREGGASWRIVDGKQRIETVRQWVSDGFTVPAEWFRDADLDRPSADEVVFSELTERGRRQFTMGCQLPALELNAQSEWLGRDGEGKGLHRRRSDEEILLAEAELYLLVNGAGTPHTDADLRAAAGIVASR